MATVSENSLEVNSLRGNAIKAQMIEEGRVSKANIQESSPVSSPDEGIDRGLRQPHFVILRSYSHTLKYIKMVLNWVIIGQKKVVLPLK